MQKALWSIQYRTKCARAGLNEDAVQALFFIVLNSNQYSSV
jgi:hypothetical protein